MRLTYIVILASFVFSSCKKETPKKEILTNDLSKEIEEIDSIFEINNALTVEFVKKSSIVYYDYLALLWLRDNIEPLHNDFYSIERDFYKRSREIRKRIDTISYEGPAINFNKDNTRMVFNPIEKEKTKVTSRLSNLTALFEVQSLLLAQTKTITPVLANEYDENNWVRFDNEKVKTQTKSYLDRITELRSKLNQ